MKTITKFFKDLNAQLEALKVTCELLLKITPIIETAVIETASKIMTACGDDLQVVAEAWNAADGGAPKKRSKKTSRSATAKKRK